MDLITAPERFENLVWKHSVFLAGAIDMGAAVDWQAEVIKALTPHKITVVNPRRAKFDETTLDEQILWELEALEDVNRIFMWFPKDAKAPISFFESGLYLRSHKMIIGAELGFYRRRNLELTTRRYGVKLHESIETMLAQLISDLVF